MTAEQRMRMRRFEVVCERAIARLNGVPEPSVAEVIGRSNVLELPAQPAKRRLAESIELVGLSIMRVLQVHRFVAVWWKRHRRRR